MTNLFSPVDLLGVTLPNRVFMSAMTRTRAGDDGVPTDLMRDYHVQRAGAGLIVTECTQVSEQAHGIIRCPGLHRDDQVAGWRRITDAVHAAGGRIVCQLWHCGRVAHPDMRGGEAPVAPSPIPAEGKFYLPSGEVDAIAFGVPFIANPDLPERLRRDAPLNNPDPATFYGEGPQGYTDYPTLAA